MKFKIQLKNPDDIYDGIGDAAKKAVDAIEGIDADERDALLAARHEKLSDFASRWIEYGEYITVEFDTEANTAVVVSRK